MPVSKPIMTCRTPAPLPREWLTRVRAAICGLFAVLAAAAPLHAQTRDIGVHGEMLDRIAAIVKKRRETRDPNHRFLLALLLNAPDRAALLDLVRERFPEDPVERVATWVQELGPPPSTDASRPSAWSEDERTQLRSLLRAEAEAEGSALRKQLRGDRVLELLVR